MFLENKSEVKYLGLARFLVGRTVRDVRMQQTRNKSLANNGERGEEIGCRTLLARFLQEQSKQGKRQQEDFCFLRLGGASNKVNEKEADKKTVFCFWEFRSKTDQVIEKASSSEVTTTNTRHQSSLFFFSLLRWTLKTIRKFSEM